jgi:hypothetical protein
MPLDDFDLNDDAAVDRFSRELEQLRTLLRYMRMVEVYQGWVKDQLSRVCWKPQWKEFIACGGVTADDLEHFISGGSRFPIRRGKKHLKVVASKPRHERIHRPRPAKHPRIIRPRPPTPEDAA